MHCWEGGHKKWIFRNSTNFHTLPLMPFIHLSQGWEQITCSIMNVRSFTPNLISFEEPPQLWLLYFNYRQLLPIYGSLVQSKTPQWNQPHLSLPVLLDKPWLPLSNYAHLVIMLFQPIKNSFRLVERLQPWLQLFICDDLCSQTELVCAHAHTAVTVHLGPIIADGCQPC